MKLAAKTVLFVVPRFHTNLAVAVRVLQDAGCRPAVFANHSAKNEDHTTVAPVVFGDDPDPRALAAAWSELKPDLVFIRHARRLSEEVARLCRRERKTCYAYSLTPLSFRRPWLGRLQRRLRGQPAHRVTPVPGLDRQAPPDPNATLLPWPVLRHPVDILPPRDDDRLRILCVGKLRQPRKNQDKLIAAIRAAGLESRVHLTLAGGTSDAEAFDPAHFAALEAAGMEDWVTLRADVPFARMPELYAANDLCILPAVDEPLGFAPLEAMAYGCVPVISAQSGSAGFLTPWTDGVVVDMTQPEALAAALLRLVADPDLRRRMSAAAAATAQGELGPERFVVRIENLLQSI